MRSSLWLLMVLAGAGSAQWRHFGSDPSPAAKASMPQEMLAVQNAVRARVGVAPLVWSARLATLSHEWAAHLLAHRQFAHRPNSSFGENLFAITGAPASSTQVVEAWAAESRNYDYASNRCRGVCGHYTQIVWSSTREVGCGVARGRGREVWVCDYDPPGNYVGMRPY